jgi:hypothetical protein
MEPQDPGAVWAAGGGHLRASDADRERAIDVLKAAFVQGLLSKSELARRAGQALESRTYAELAFATYYGSFFILLLFGFGAATVIGSPGSPGSGRYSAY